MKTYDIDAAQPKLGSLKGWQFKSNAIEKEFQFKNFKEAMTFMVKVGDIAEEKNHHPEFFNVYNKVRLRLNTHSAGGLTDKDFELANLIEERAVKF